MQFSLTTCALTAAEVGAVQRLWPHMSITLPLSSSRMRLLHDDPAAFLVEMMPYALVVDHLLFDQSHGRGRGLDIEGMSVRLKTIHRLGLHRHVGFIIAGGLSAESMGAYRVLVRERGFRIGADAESGLREDGKFNVRRALDYTYAVAEILDLLP